MVKLKPPTKAPPRLGRPVSSPYGRCVAIHISVPEELHEAAVRYASRQKYMGYSKVYQEALLRYLGKKGRPARIPT